MDREPVIECTLCGKRIWARESYAPADDAICGACDTEVTGRKHGPDLNPDVDPEPPEWIPGKLKLFLYHGRDNPDQDMDGEWGYNGPELLNIEQVHCTYQGHYAVTFANAASVAYARELTGWDYLDDLVLETEYHEGLLVTQTEVKPRYFGDWILDTQTIYGNS